MSSGCCFTPAVYIACDESDWAGLPGNWTTGVWSLPKVTIFTLEPQLPTINRIRHSDSNGVEVSLCALQNVTWNSTISYAQCYPGMEYFLRTGDIFDTRFYPFFPDDHATSAVDVESQPYYSLETITRAGTLTYDANNLDGQISTITLEGRDVIAFPSNTQTLGPYAVANFGVCAVNFGGSLLTWPDDGTGPPANDFTVSQFGAAEQTAVNAIPGLPASPQIGDIIQVLYQHTMANHPTLTDKKSIVSWIYNGTEYSSPSFVSTQEIV